MAARELEEHIGGRTTLELKFQDVDAAAATAALTKATGLPFVLPDPSTGPTILFNGGPAESIPQSYSANVAKADFWLGVRTWNQTEAARLQQEKEEMQSGRARPLAEAAQQQPGQSAAPSDSYKARAFKMARQAPSVRLDPGRRAWSLAPRDEIATGRSFNSWPCLLLATGFSRSQSLSLQDEKPQAAAPAPAVAPIMARTVIAAGPDGGNESQGGRLSDTLQLNMLLCLEPKLLDRARLEVQVSEATDDKGENLLPLRDKSKPLPLRKDSDSDSGDLWRLAVPLMPRQSKGSIAHVRGKVLVSYPMEVRQYEITDFSAPHTFPLTAEGFAAQARINPPSLSNGHLNLTAEAVIDSKIGGRAVRERQHEALPGAGGFFDGFLGHRLLPALSQFTFTDTQGRTWHPDYGGTESGRVSTMNSPEGPSSPPPPQVEGFIYAENWRAALNLYPSEALAPVANDPEAYMLRMPDGGFTPPLKISPEELAKVKFVKATFATEGSWRTIEVPFEFRDLPLPPR